MVPLPRSAARLTGTAMLERAGAASSDTFLAANGKSGPFERIRKGAIVFVPSPSSADPGGSGPVGVCARIPSQVMITRPGSSG